MSVQKIKGCRVQKCGMVIYGKTTDRHFCADCVDKSTNKNELITIDEGVNLVIVESETNDDN